MVRKGLSFTAVCISLCETCLSIIKVMYTDRQTDRETRTSQVWTKCAQLVQNVGHSYSLAFTYVLHKYHPLPLHSFKYRKL